MGESYYRGAGLDYGAVRSRIGKGEILGEEEVMQIFDALTDVLYREENVLILQSPIIVVGDIHGQLEDLEFLLSKAITNIRSDKFLFMGDYVDRGHHSLNTFLLLAVSKLQYPLQYFLLRGNHESRQVSQQYGFQSEVILHYGHLGLWLRCMNLFDLLPYAAIIDGDVFSVHGGISPMMPLIDKINTKNRMRETPQYGMITDLVWSDPDDDVTFFRANARGAGFLFGRAALRRFCHNNKLMVVTRSHQLAPEGFKWSFGEAGEATRGRLLTVWSVPNYAYVSNNVASFLKLRYDRNEPFELHTFTEATQRIDMKHVEGCVPKYFA
jgi:diadenosine tetraphosphatase ApaH/serine/threonine PP2A family protein phosphatase